MPRVVHFEIPADNPERAAKFYKEVFGWKIDKWKGAMDYWLVMTGEKTEPGIDGGLMRKEAPTVSTTDTLGMPSVDDFTEEN